MNNFNVNLTKSFVVHENIKVQFRAESFNLTNRPVFATPNLTSTARPSATLLRTPIRRAPSSWRYV